MKSVTSFLFYLLIAAVLTGCGGGGSSAPSTTGTISGTISLPSNTNAKLFEARPPFYSKLFSSPVHAETISDLTKLTVTASGASTNPDAGGKYTLTVNAGTNIELTVTAPSGNVVLSAIVPSVTAGAAATQNIDTTTTAVALIYKQNTNLTISQITSSGGVTYVKDIVEAVLTDPSDGTTISDSSVAFAVKNAATNILGDIATQISAGVFHTCALTEIGAVKCWGGNTSGQIGNGESSIPVGIAGLSSGVIAISAGGLHTCALTSGGGVKCWGDNSYGQLGNGSSINNSTPVDVTGLTTGISSISAGVWHTCVLTVGGAVKCWGANDSGQLGNGDNTNSFVPVDVTGLSTGIRSITTGFKHTCAVAASGDVKCWGSDFSGQLGNKGNDSNIPVDVINLADVVAISAGGGYHTCALTTNGAVKCWGWNVFGQLGIGTNKGSVSVPVDVTGLSIGVSAITEGFKHTCAINSGMVKCWGDNMVGQIGNGDIIGPQICTFAGLSYACSVTPVDVVGITSGVSAITAGGAHTCVLISGSIKCWGLNDYGQLGDGSYTGPQTCNNSSCSTTPVDVVGFGG